MVGVVTGFVKWQAIPKRLGIQHKNLASGVLRVLVSQCRAARGTSDAFHCVMGKDPKMAQETTEFGLNQKKEPAEGATGSVSTKMTDAERDEAASKLVDRFSLWSGAAGLIPVPLVDIAAVGGVQLQMLRRLSEIYGVPFSDNRGKSIIASLAGAVLPASTATTTAVSVGSALKTIPGIGTAIATCTMPVFSAGATWVIGKVFIQHFASGGTLLDFNPPDYREFIKAQKEKLSARSAAPSASPASTTRGTSKGAGISSP